MPADAATVIVTRNPRRLEADERGAYRKALNLMARAGEIVDFGVLYMIEQASDSSGQVKIGITSQTGLPNRASVNQTGSPYEQRVVSLCVFQSRDVAKVVEQRLKAKHRATILHGGTEWVGVSRQELLADVVAIAHELQLHQLRVNASPPTVVSMDDASVRHFYGAILLELIDGDIVRYRENSMCAPAAAPTAELSAWEHLREFLRKALRRS